MSDYGAERRFPRFPAEHTALVRTVDSGVEGFARTSAMSVGGCGVVTRESLSSGLAVELLLTIEGRVVQVFGRTVYCRDISDGRVEVGVEFLDVLDDDVALLEEVLGRPR